MKKFAGKVAVVTGSSGIGLGAALHFAREGAKVFICGIDEDINKKAIKAGAGMNIKVSKVDVSDPAQVEAWIGSIALEDTGIDILVNAAAIQTYGDTETTDINHWNRVISTNLNSCFLTSHFAYPLMKARGGGSIVHVSSVQGHSNQHNVLAYATSKGAIHALVRAQAVDAAKDNIRVNSISPGSIRTPLLEYAAQVVVGEGNPIEDTIAEFGKCHPIGRVGTIEETSALIDFLCSEKSGFCSGSDFKIDGALLAYIGV